MQTSSQGSHPVYWNDPENKKVIENGQRSGLNVNIGSGTISNWGLIMLLLLGSLLLLTWQSTKILEWYRLEHHAHLSDARVDSVEKRFNDDDKLIGYEIIYAYQVNKEYHLGRADVSIKEGEATSPDQSIKILYDDEAPQNSLLVAHDSVWGYVPLLAENSVFFVVSLLFYLRLRGKRKRVRTLISEGTFVEGEIKRASIDEGDDGPDRLNLVVTYDALSGEPRELNRLLDLPVTLPAEGSKVKLVIHPQLTEIGIL